MASYKITNLDQAALADARFLRRPELAKWQEGNAAGGVYDAAGKNGLRVTCAGCGTVLDEVASSPNSQTYVQCPCCGDRFFRVDELQKEKKPTYPSPLPKKTGKTFGEWFLKSFGIVILSFSLGWLANCLILIIHPVLFYRIGSKIGIESAPDQLAKCYKYGEGWFQASDPEKEFETYKEYAQKGRAECAYMLAQYYAHDYPEDNQAILGNWLPWLDYEKAAEWYLKAGRNNLAASCYNKLGDSLLHGEEGPRAYYSKDIRKAVDAYRKAYKLDPGYKDSLSSALYNLGCEYEQVYERSKFRPDWYRALYNYEESAELGYQKAKQRIRKIRYSGRPD